MSLIQEPEQQEKPLPQTVEELHTFVAQSLNKILAIPENALILATALTNAQLKAMHNAVQHEQATATPELVLTRVEHSGCVRAEVIDPKAEDGLLDVVLTMRSEEDPETWTTDIQFGKEQQSAFKRAVLSQTALPGDIFFLTTTIAVNAAHKAAAEALVAQSEQINKMADAAEKLHAQQTVAAQ